MSEANRQIEHGITMLFRAHRERDWLLIDAALRHLVLLDDLGFIRNWVTQQAQGSSSTEGRSQ